jgi:hypothetical protein
MYVVEHLLATKLGISTLTNGELVYPIAYQRNYSVDYLVSYFENMFLCKL